MMAVGQENCPLFYFEAVFGMQHFLITTDKTALLLLYKTCIITTARHYFCIAISNLMTRNAPIFKIITVKYEIKPFVCGLNMFSSITNGLVCHNYVLLMIRLGFC